MDSILLSIKKLLGVGDMDTAFDQELLLHINSAFSVLTQLRVGPETGFKISGDLETWDSFLPPVNYLENAKLFVYYSVRLSFDPPQNSFLVDSIKEQLKETGWRLEVATAPDTP